MGNPAVQVVVCYLWKGANPSVNGGELEYQTNWTLEPVLSFCDSELATTQTDNGGQD